jgi:YhcN/YlaJ family sporulation lipoprotein
VIKVNAIHKFTVIGLSAALFCSIAGCGSEYDVQSQNNYSSQRIKEPKNNSRAYQTTQQFDSVEHTNTKLELNQPLIEVVQAVDGVNSAIVMTTDRFAYVAIALDNTATGTKGIRSRRETNNKGTSSGSYNYNTGSQHMNPNDLISGYNSYETVENHQDISHAFKQRIAEQIRLARPDIHDVFISANRQFINRLNYYAQESWKGHSLQAYLPEFNQMVMQIFGTGPSHAPWNANR